MCVNWGPFLFTGDTVLDGDVGRDDLPGGDAETHYVSLMRLKEIVNPKWLVFPGHGEAKNISSWSTQLKRNPSLQQSHHDFVQEAAAFDGPAPKLLKASLRENLR